MPSFGFCGTKKWGLFLAESAKAGGTNDRYRSIFLDTIFRFVGMKGKQNDTKFKTETPSLDGSSPSTTLLNGTLLNGTRSMAAETAESDKDVARASNTERQTPSRITEQAVPESAITQSSKNNPPALKNSKPGPFQIVRDDEPEVQAVAPSLAPKRRYDCSNYEQCLDVATALDWDSFTCRGCTGEPDQQLLWRARQNARKDKIASSLITIPKVKIVGE